MIRIFRSSSFLILLLPPVGNISLWWEANQAKEPSQFGKTCNFFFLNRTTAPAAQTQLFRTHRANRIALTVHILFGLWLGGMNA